MSFQFDTLHLTHQLTTGIGYPTYLGLNQDVIRGSVYLDGPTVIGDETVSTNVEGSLVVGPCNNEDSPIPWICDPTLLYSPTWTVRPCGVIGVGAEKYQTLLANPYSLVVKSGKHKVRDIKCVPTGYKNFPIVEIESQGAAFFEGDVDIYGYTRVKDRLCVTGKADFENNVVIRQNIISGGNLYIGDICVANIVASGNADIAGNVVAGGNVNAGRSVNALGGDVTCPGHSLSAKKDFDIPHPTREGWRLTHACIEGPEAAVYVRGRVKNKTEIQLPEYWTKLVDAETITVSLTPIGAHQDVIVKRIGDNKIYLQSKGGMPIDCFYHVFAERIDTEKLIPEYQGTIEDYPGDNSQRSIVGYHYDVKDS